MTTRTDHARAYPVGVCYCGCGTKLDNPSKFFVASHDRKLEAKIIRECYGDVATFALAHGYGPETNPAGGASEPRG